MKRFTRRYSFTACALLLGWLAAVAVGAAWAGEPCYKTFYYNLPLEDPTRIASGQIFDPTSLNQPARYEYRIIDETDLERYLNKGWEFVDAYSIEVIVDPFAGTDKNLTRFAPPEYIKQNKAIVRRKPSCHSVSPGR